MPKKRFLNADDEESDWTSSSSDEIFKNEKLLELMQEIDDGEGEVMF